MSIIQFLRILWVHRLLTVFTTVATVIGAGIAVLIIPPSYEGSTRIMLNTLRPDPVTGEIIGMNARTFMTTQSQLILDYGVAGQAVDKLGWLSNPETIAQYEADEGDGDLRRALAQRIIDRTNVKDVGGTNILEIVFRGSSPDDARTMANALRESYIESTLSARRLSATRNADWYIQQAEKERVLLAQAEAEKTAFERQSGIVMQDDKTDIETARLRALSGQSSLGGAMVAPQAAVQSSQAAIQLAQLDAQIDQAGRTLGPNHPTMLQMKLQRSSLARVVAEDQAAARAALAQSSRSVSASAVAVETAVRRQPELSRTGTRLSV
jgi:polysaccharide biosynthesis transport protein